MLATSDHSSPPNAPPPSPPPRGKAMTRLSSAVYALERRLLQGLMAAILLLTLTNIGFTAYRQPIYWATEALIALMTVAAFIGQSMLVRIGGHPGVTLLAEIVPLQMARVLGALADFALLVLSALLLVLAWRLFDPIGVLPHWSDPLPYAIETGKFTWLEPTDTLGISRAWLWLAPVPAFLFSIVHAAARLLDPHHAKTLPEEA